MSRRISSTRGRSAGSHAAIPRSAAKASALAETSGRRGEVLLSLVEDQEWLNPTLLIVLSTQLVQSTLLGVLASRLFGGWGVVAATLLNVTLFFVVAEVAPKTWAIQHTDRAALASARPIKALAGWGPLRLVSRALIGLTKTLSLELGQHGVRVNAIAPGAVAGERAERVFQGRAQASGRSIEEEKRLGMANQSLKELVDPADIARLAVFLASDAGKSISGQVLPIDGNMQRA